MSPQDNSVKHLRRVAFWGRILAMLPLFGCIVCFAKFIDGDGWYWALWGGICSALFIDFMVGYVMTNFRLAVAKEMERGQGR